MSDNKDNKVIVITNHTKDLKLRTLEDKRVKACVQNDLLRRNNHADYLANVGVSLLMT